MRNEGEGYRINRSQGSHLLLSGRLLNKLYFIFLVGNNADKFKTGGAGFI